MDALRAENAALKASDVQRKPAYMEAVKKTVKDFPFLELAGGAFAIASSGSGTGIAAGGGRAGRTRERPRAARRGGYARDASTRRVEGRSSRAGRSARRA